MIEQKTAFIIGAGGSRAYGFPTGDGLCEEILNMRVNFDIFSNTKVFYWYSKDKYLEFIDTFQESGLKSIDTFLGIHSEYENEGKAVISYLIKQHELKSYKSLSIKKDWLFLLFNKIIDGMLNPEDYYNRNNVYF